MKKKRKCKLCKGTKLVSIPTSCPLCQVQWYQNKEFGTDNPDEILINPKECKNYKKYGNCCFNRICRKDCKKVNCGGSMGLSYCYLMLDTTSRCSLFELKKQIRDSHKIGGKKNVRN